MATNKISFEGMSLLGNSNLVSYDVAVAHHKENATSKEGSVIISPATQLCAAIYVNFVGEIPQVSMRSGVKDDKKWTSYELPEAEINKALNELKLFFPEQ
jgi:hypothetical protein